MKFACVSGPQGSYNYIDVDGDVVELRYNVSQATSRGIVGVLGRQRGKILIGYLLRNVKVKLNSYSFPKNGGTLISYKKQWLEEDKIQPTMRPPLRDSNLLNYIMISPIPVRWKWACRYLTPEGFQALKNVVRIMWSRDVRDVSFEYYRRAAPGIHVHDIGAMYATYRTLMTYLRENLTEKDSVYRPDAVLRNPYPLYDYEVAYCMHYLGSQQENFTNAINIVGHLAIAIGNAQFTVDSLAEKKKRRRITNFSAYQNKQAKDWYFIIRAMLINNTTLHDVSILMGY